MNSPTPSVPVRSSRSDESAAVRAAEQALVARVEKTRSEVRRVDVFSAICAFATFGLGVLFFGVLLDHWILPNGFSPRGRLIYCVFWLVSTTLFFATRLFPALRRRVNPLFAAKTLEESWQDPHNLTINWLQLRAARRRADANSNADASAKSDGAADENSASEPTFDALEAAVLRGVVLQAANKASAAAAETTVDCAPLIRWGAAFAVVVAVCAGYSVFSPKNPFASAGRVAAPFATIDRPQAIRFEKIVPGDAVVFQGDSLDVEAEIPGAGTLPVVLLYSTEDGRLTDRKIPMEALDGRRFRAKFPDSDAGFEENLTYRLVVGRGSRFESRGPIFRVEVRPKPSFRVEKTTLKFPDYSGLAAQTFENQGDVRALEGTTVELVARSNVPLSGAFFLPDGDETRAQAMKISSDNQNLATFSFVLAWKSTADGEKTPEFSSYRLRSEDRNGEKNRDERLYSVETLADLPPTIRWRSAPEGVAEIPLNDALRLEVEAEDADFGLRAVRLRTAIRDLNEGANATRPNPAPIDAPLRSSDVAATGPTPFVGTLVLPFAVVPEQLGLKVGDEIEYWAEAVDTKLPDGGVAATEKRLFAVVEPVANPTPLDAKAEQEPEQEDAPQENGENAQNKQNSPNGEEGKDGQNGKSGDSRQNNEKNNDNEDGANASEKNGDNQEKDDDSGKNDAQKNESGANDASSDADSSDAERRPQEENGAKSDKPSQNSPSSDASGGASGASEGAENERSPADGANGGASNSAETNGDANGKGGPDGGDSSNSSDSSGNSDSSDPSGSSSDSSNGGQKTPDGGANASESGAASSESASGRPENAPIDPESNPGDAFEKILEHINQENAQKSSSNRGGAGQANANDTGNDGESASENDGSNDDSNGGAGSDAASEQGRSTENDADATSDSRGDADDAPTSERDLPSTSSSDKPKEDSPRYRANDPGRIDPNARRDRGDVDPKTNDFLAQNADPNDARTPKTAAPDANVVRDPLDRTPETPGDATNPNAREAKGPNDSNGANDAPFEVVREGDDADSNDSAPEPTDPNAPPLDPAELPADAARGPGASNGGDAATGSGASSDADDAPNGGAGSDRTPKNAASDPTKRAPASGGASDSPSGVRGGGGGSGLGELGADAETLAPAGAPTLRYAEQTTNLVLDYLENSLKNRTDARLRDELGWSEDELRAFLERWQKMRSDAATDADADAKNRYLQALENVGLTPEPDAEPLDATRENDDGKRPRSTEAARESARAKTPDALRDRVRAFRRGVADGARR